VQYVHQRIKNQIVKRKSTKVCSLRLQSLKDFPKVQKGKYFPDITSVARQGGVSILAWTPITAN
jgi:hypothetical protein